MKASVSVPKVRGGEECVRENVNMTKCGCVSHKTMNHFNIFHPFHASRISQSIYDRIEDLQYNHGAEDLTELWTQNNLWNYTYSMKEKARIWWMTEAATAEAFWTRELLCPPRGGPIEGEKPSLVTVIEHLQKVGVFPGKSQTARNVALKYILVKAWKMWFRMCVHKGCRLWRTVFQ